MGFRDDANLPGSKRLVAGAFVATALVHGGIIGGVWLGHARAEVSRAPVLGEVIDVQAVRFGKPRDMSFLPHKEAAPTPRPKPKLALTQNEKALPKMKDPNQPEPAKQEEDPLKRTHTDQFRNLPSDDNNTGSAVGEGDPHGVVGGTATQGKGPIYLQHLVAAVQNAWEIPTNIKDEELRRLVGVVYFRVDDEGNLTDVKLQTPSGDARFDNTLMAAFATLKKLDPPTADVKALLAEGVALRFKYERAH
jgi:TonB family protein